MALTRAQIQTAFQNSLGRAASTSDENSFFSVSQSGALTDAQIFTTISDSREADVVADPVIRFYQAAFGRVPDQQGLVNFENFIRQNGSTLATYTAVANTFVASQEFTNRFGTGTAVDAAYVQALYGTILGRAATSAEVDGYVSGAAGYTTRGGVLYAVSQSNEANAISNAAVNGFQLNAAQGTAVYQGSLYTTQNGGSTGPTSGQTLSLTTGVDNIVGTANNDTVSGVVDATTPANSTLTAADTINLGAGTDRLNITVAAGAGTLPAANISGVENFFIRDVGTGGTYNLGTVTGEQQVWSDRSTAATTFTNVGTSSTAGVGATIGVQGDGSSAVGNVTFAYATLTDQVAIAINGGITGGTTNITNSGATTATTASISSTGGVNNVGTIDLSASADLITALNINAATNLTATLLDNDTINTGAALTVSGAATSVNLGAGGEFKTIDASGLTAGGLTVTLDTFLTSFKGGQGNDVVTTAALTTTTDSAVNAGAGTADKLVVAATANVDTAIEAKLYAGFEILRTAAETVDLSLFTNSTITSLEVGGNATFNNINSTQAGAVTVFADSAATFNVTGANTVGQLDTLGLTVDNGVAGKQLVTLGNITAAGVETITINAVDNATVSSLTGATALTKLTVSGAGDVSVTTGALVLNVNSAIDASAATGAVTIDATAGTTNGLKITGSSTAVNVLTGTAQADVIIGGSGNDTLTGGVGLDTLTGGAGANTFVFANTSTGQPSDSVFDTITDYRAGTNNKIDFGAIVLQATAGGSGASGQAAISTNGVATFNAADTTLAQKLTAVSAAITATGAASVAGETAIFQQGSDAYVFVSDNADGLSAADVLIKLTGVTVGANGLTFTAGDITAIA